MWSLLEDSVNIDDLEGIYGEVPEGTVASITLFALPEGEEEAQADSDVEPYSFPKAKKGEASLRAEAASPEHELTHRPKNPFCPICKRAKVYAPQARKTGGSSTIYSKAFADHITVDHIITADAKDYGFQEETVAHVVKDVYSKFRYVYPSKTKSCEQCYEDMLHFLGVDDEVKVIYSDNALGFRLCNCVLVTTLLESMLTRTKQLLNVRSERSLRVQGLMQSGLPDRYWPLASQHHAICLNITMRLDNGQIPWDIRFGSKFNGKRIPFGAKVLHWAPKKQKKPERSKFVGAGIKGIFLGFYIQPGFIFNDEYLVAPLHNIANALENEDLRVFRAKRLELPEGGFTFPLVTESAVEQLPNFDAQHHNVLDANSPHPPLEEGGGHTEAEIQEQL